jgi:hypothetical protein
MGSIQRQLNILLLTSGSLGERQTINGGDIVEVLAANGGNKLATDEVVIAGLEVWSSNKVTHSFGLGH